MGGIRAGLTGGRRGNREPLRMGNYHGMFPQFAPMGETSAGFYLLLKAGFNCNNGKQIIMTDISNIEARVRKSSSSNSA